MLMRTVEIKFILFLLMIEDIGTYNVERTYPKYEEK